MKIAHTRGRVSIVVHFKRCGVMGVSSLMLRPHSIEEMDVMTHYQDHLHAIMRYWNREIIMAMLDFSSVGFSAIVPYTKW